jgi:DNA-binding transcriptional ArsR family regulator
MGRPPRPASAAGDAQEVLWDRVVGPSVRRVTSIDVLRAVHHPTRRRMLELLHLRGPCRVGTLAGELGEQVGSISHHLRMLERAGVVARVPELATDGRTSWWRLELTSLSWSADDFAVDAAERTQARAAERLNIGHHVAKLATWTRESDRADPAWRRAAFSSDFVAMASPGELTALQEALVSTVRAWQDGIDTGDGQERAPVFVFAHGFRSRP